MKLSEKSFTSCNIFLSTILMIWYSFLFSTLILKSTLAENIDKTNFGINLKDINDLRHISPYIKNHNFPSLKIKNKFSTIESLARMARTKYLQQYGLNPKILESTKRQTNEDLPPPGFVGARGRRLNNLVDWHYYKEKRNPTEDYKLLTEVFPDFWPHLDNNQMETTTDYLMAARLASGKKSDNIVYKDGFLGVRG